MQASNPAQRKDSGALKGHHIRFILIKDLSIAQGGCDSSSRRDKASTSESQGRYPRDWRVKCAATQRPLQCAWKSRYLDPAARQFCSCESWMSLGRTQVSMAFRKALSRPGLAVFCHRIHLSVKLLHGLPANNQCIRCAFAATIATSNSNRDGNYLHEQFELVLKLHITPTDAQAEGRCSEDSDRKADSRPSRTPRQSKPKARRSLVRRLQGTNAGGHGLAGDALTNSPKQC